METSDIQVDLVIHHQSIVDINSIYIIDSTSLVRYQPLRKLNPAELIPGLRPANERRRYFVTTSLIDWVQA